MRRSPLAELTVPITRTSGVGFQPVETAAVRLRIRSIARSLRRMALDDRWGTLLVLAAAGIVVWGAVRALADVANVRYAVAGAGVILWVVHGERADERHLRRLGARPARVWAVEYAALTVPLGLLCLLGGGPIWSWERAGAAGLIVSVGLVVSMLSAGRLRRWRERWRGRRRMPMPVPGEAFEWASGLRRSGGWLIAGHTAVALLSVRWPHLALGYLLLLAYVVAGWHGDTTEEWPLVVALQRTPRSFLRRKVVLALACYGVIAAPIGAVAMAAAPDAWPAVVVLAVIAAALVTGTVCYKYAFFAPGRHSPLRLALFAAAFALSLSVPPVAVLILVALWRRARLELAPYIAPSIAYEGTAHGAG